LGARVNVCVINNDKVLLVNVFENIPVISLHIDKGHCSVVKYPDFEMTIKYEMIKSQEQDIQLSYGPVCYLSEFKDMVNKK